MLFFESLFGELVDDGVDVLGAAEGALEPDESELAPAELDAAAPESEPELDPDPPSGLARESVR